MKGFTVVELLVVIAIIGILLACLGLGEPIFRFFFGWILFLVHNLPEVRFRPAALAQGLVAFALLLWATHSFLAWLYGRRAQPSKSDEDTSQPVTRAWRFRWSAACVVLVVVMFVAGISMIVLVHQVGWLMASDEPWMTSGMSAARRMQSSNNLKQIGLGMHNYHDVYDSFPPGGTLNRYGEMQHGWTTHLLPYLERQALHDQVRWDLPWDHEENTEVFSTRIDVLRNPSLHTSDHDERGYALGHYAANVRVVGPDGSLSVKDIPDGTSNTILAGEVQEQLQPWGSPTNWRDPVTGIDRGPHSFGGGRNQGGAQFVFADGSIHYLSEDIDPSVLKALATPTGTEPVDGDW